MIKILRKWFNPKTPSLWNGICVSEKEFNTLVCVSIECEPVNYIIDNRGDLSSLRNEIIKTETEEKNKILHLKKQWLKNNGGDNLMFFQHLFNINKKWVNHSFQGETPLQYSAKNNALLTTKMLVSAGADVFLKDVPQGRQPFMLANYHQAMVMGSKNCAAFLLSNRISSKYWEENVCDDLGSTFIQSIHSKGLHLFSSEILKSVLLLLKDYQEFTFKTPILHEINNQLQRLTLENIVASVAIANDPPKKRKM